ncbi:MAG: PEP-utilizing enzyme, partial [bacterium]|nr:PEP-utilizing enzyme [bacterium]
MKKGRAVKKMRGLAVSPGMALGKVHLLDRGPTTFPKYWISDREVVSETLRFRQAMELVQKHLLKVRDKLCKFQIGEEIRILDTYQMIARDEVLFAATLNTIQHEKINAEWALDKSLLKIKATFSETDSDFFKERQSDAEHVGALILRNLLGRGEESLHHFKKGTILVAHDLSPAQTAQIARGSVEGFVTEIGGATSHTAIIAKALEIPAIVGLEGILEQVSQGSSLILDGTKGIVIVNPNASEKKKYRQAKQKFERIEKTLL